MKNTKTVKLILCALFAALMAVGAFMRIPTPFVPITFQTLFSILSGLLLGGKLGAASVSVYIAMGLVGIPVFTEGGGPWYVLKPTFGYLIGFAAGAYITGAVANNTETPSLKRILCAVFAGIAVIYILGIIHYFLISHLYTGTNIGFRALFFYCFVMPFPGDVLPCILAAFAAKRIIPIRNKYLPVHKKTQDKPIIKKEAF